MLLKILMLGLLLLLLLLTVCFMCTSLINLFYFKIEVFLKKNHQVDLSRHTFIQLRTENEDDRQQRKRLVIIVFMFYFEL